MRDESRPGPAPSLIPDPSSLRISILLSGRGRGSNMQAIIDACQSGLIPGEVVRVVSTSPETPALERARSAGVDTLFVDSLPESSLDSRLLAAFREVGADTIALA